MDREIKEKGCKQNIQKSIEWNRTPTMQLEAIVINSIVYPSTLAL